VLSHENELLRNELYSLKVKYGEIPQLAGGQQTIEPSPSETKGLTAPTPSRTVVTTAADLHPKQETSQAQFSRNISQEPPKIQIQDPASAAVALHKAMKQQQPPVIPNVLTANPAAAKPGSSNVRIGQGSMPFPPNLLISHLASGTYVLSPVSPNGPQNLIAGHIAPVSQPTIVTVQQNPAITTTQQRDGTQLVGYPAHQIPQLSMQTTLNPASMHSTQQTCKTATIPSPIVVETPPASAKSSCDSPPNPKSSRIEDISSVLPPSSRSMFSFDRMHEQQRSHRKSIEQQQREYRHRSTSHHSDHSRQHTPTMHQDHMRRQQQQQLNNEPVNLEVNKEAKSQTLSTQTSPVYYPPPQHVPHGGSRSRQDSCSSSSSSYKESSTTGFIPADAGPGCSPKDTIPPPAKPRADQEGSKRHSEDSDSLVTCPSTPNENSNNSAHSGQFFRGAQSPVESVAGSDVSSEDARRLSPSPDDEGYQVYRKGFHKLQDEKDFEAATTLATLSKRSKLHHLDASSYSMDAVSSSLQVVGSGDERSEDGRKHRLPHKLRFKFHNEREGTAPEGQQMQTHPTKMSE